MVSHNSRRPRLVLLLGTALYLHAAILPTTVAAKSRTDSVSDLAQTNSLVANDRTPQQGQHISDLQQDSQTVASARKNKDKTKKKGDKKAQESTVDAKAIKAHKNKTNKDQDKVDGNDDSDDEEEDDDDDDDDDDNNDEKKGDDQGDKNSSKENDLHSYLADLWKGIVHLGEEPDIQAGIAAITSRIHGVTKHHGKRDVIQQQQQQQQQLSDGEQGRQGEEGALIAPAVKPFLVRPNHHRVHSNIQKKTVKVVEGAQGLAHPEKSGGKSGVNRGNEDDDVGDSEEYEIGYDEEQDEGRPKKSSLPKIGQRVVFGKDGQVVGLAVDVGPGHPTGHGVSEAERFVKYGNEIMTAGESMMTGHDLANALTPAPHPFLVLEKRQRPGTLRSDVARDGAGAATAPTTAGEVPQLEMDMGLKRVEPDQEPEIGRAMDRAIDDDPQRKAKKDKGQEVDAGLQAEEKIAKKLRKQNDDAFQAVPAEQTKDKKVDPFQKAFDKMFGDGNTKERKKEQADPFEADVPKRHRNKNKADDGFDNVPIEVQKEKKKDKHGSKSGGNDKDIGGGEPAHKDQGLGNGDMGKANDRDTGKSKQEPPAGAAPEPGMGAGINQANRPPDRTGPAPVSGNKKDSTTPGGFGTVPMFGPAQLDLGSGASVSTVLSTWTCAFAVAAALMVTLVNC
ncbi:hypothetical protein BGZ68_008960 [Mortierella alpina]|nr:hypothetical protein BGZ68_008960 [Mortierella alpina]